VKARQLTTEENEMKQIYIPPPGRISRMDVITRVCNGIDLLVNATLTIGGVLLLTIVAIGIFS
jgi:hypothetical protein